MSQKNRNKIMSKKGEKRRTLKKPNRQKEKRQLNAKPKKAKKGGKKL
jgi:hypothetical protein